MLCTRLRRPILNIQYVKSFSALCYSGNDSSIKKRNGISFVNSNSTVKQFQRRWFHLNVLHLVNEKESYEKYEKSTATPVPHFKKTIDERASSTEQELKTTDIISCASDKNDQEYLLPHPIWSRNECESVEITHKKPVGFSDKAAYYTVQTMRKCFDIFSGYSYGKYMNTLDERAVLIRCIFLETVAGVPGFAAAMIRHLHSLRRMQRDHGWIHTLLEEAENERMHLMSFLQLRKPGPIFRYSVIFSQWIFTGAFSLTYLVSPKFCHRFVGYLEEEAVKTYTHIIEEMDAGSLPMWSRLQAPEIAIKYWQLKPDAMMRDMILAIRADEAHHRFVNHTLSSMNLKDQNPFKAGE